MTHLPPSSIVNPLTAINNNSSSPGGSSSVLTMESLDSLEGFETSSGHGNNNSTESGFIASRPSMAELMGSMNVQSAQISPVHGHTNILTANNSNNNTNNNNGHSLTSSSTSSGHLTPIMSLSHSSNSGVSSALHHPSHHDMMMSPPSHLEIATTPSTPPTNAMNPYGVSNELIMDSRGMLGQPQQQQQQSGVVGVGGQMTNVNNNSNNNSGGGGGRNDVNVAEYPWMKEKKTTRKNSSHASKSN